MTDGEDGSVGAKRGPAAELPVSDELEAWLRDRVDGTDRSIEGELERIVATHRFAVDGDRSSDPASVDSIENRIEETREEFREGIEDVRERVIQVLEETHDRAEKDHAHPEIEDAVADADEELGAIREELGAIREELDALDRRLSDSETGVDDVRSAADANADRMDDVEARLDRIDDGHGVVEHKLDRLASAVVRMRKRVERLEATTAAEDRLDSLREEANRVGVRVADCEQCDRSVTVALLTEPRCPHCDTAFGGVEPSRGFFGSSTLLTDDRPALEGRTVDGGTAEGDPGSLTRSDAGDGRPDGVDDETDDVDGDGEPDGGRSSDRE